jgi:hypothetical protein
MKKPLKKITKRRKPNLTVMLAVELTIAHLDNYNEWVEENVEALAKVFSYHVAAGKVKPTHSNWREFCQYMHLSCKSTIERRPNATLH